MKRVGQRDLRNQSAAILDAVAAGETFIVTRRGVDVAELRPLLAATGVRRDELFGPFANLPRAGDYAAERAEADAFFGTDDRIDEY